MPAWKHFAVWNDALYEEYRAYVKTAAPQLRWRSEDCADLSISLLIDFAAKRGLEVTFADNDQNYYMSRARGAPVLDPYFRWNSKEQFSEVVKRKIGVSSLWKQNTEKNEDGPMPGDLMMRYQDFRGGYHHAALVYQTYLPGILHSKWNEKLVPDFPGAAMAEREYIITEYFRGTTGGDAGATLYRVSDFDKHFDYLNHRGEAKPLAELLYFANARQIQEEGFEFRKYNSIVLKDHSFGADMGWWDPTD